jgi:hypothetical protein
MVKINVISVMKKKGRQNYSHPHCKTMLTIKRAPVTFFKLKGAFDEVGVNYGQYNASNAKRKSSSYVD